MTEMQDFIATDPRALSAAASVVLTHAGELGDGSLLANAWTVLRQAVGEPAARQAITERAERDNCPDRAAAAFAELGLPTEAPAPEPAHMPAALNGYPVVSFLPAFTSAGDLRPGEWIAACRRTEPEVHAAPYCTWRVIARPGGITCYAGEYNMTLTAALADLVTRSAIPAVS
jgi:hypothetical protein